MVEGSGHNTRAVHAKIGSSWYSPSGLTNISSAGIRGHIKALIRYGELADVLVCRRIVDIDRRRIDAVRRIGILVVRAIGKGVRIWARRKHAP